MFIKITKVIKIIKTFAIITIIQTIAATEVVHIKKVIKIVKMISVIRSLAPTLIVLHASAIALELKELPTGGAYGNFEFEKVQYGVFRANPAEVSLYWRDENGRNFHRLGPLRRELERRGQVVSLLVNAGIYTQNDYPAGLWIENGKELKKINTLSGEGNFHIQPNGVFFIDNNNKAKIRTTSAYLKGNFSPRIAVQSGPMLIINGKINRRFVKNLSSPYKRNAVCITKSGALYFILTESYRSGGEWPSFYRFGEALRSIDCQQALYLDGSISSWYIPDISNTFHWTHFVGIIAVSHAKTE